MLDFTLPKLEEEYKNPAEVICVKGMCISSANLQLIFELIIHDFSYYSQNYPETASRIKLRYMYSPRVALQTDNRDDEGRAVFSAEEGDAVQGAPEDHGRSAPQREGLLRVHRNQRRAVRFSGRRARDRTFSARR